MKPTTINNSIEIEEDKINKYTYTLEEIRQDDKIYRKENKNKKIKTKKTKR